ncbi:NAD(P)-binding domain-containing protein [Spirillospora sp. NPDC052242]
MSRIGFIGLGIMGAPMARHLVAAGHDVTGFDVAPKGLDALVGAGGAAADGVAGAVAGAEVVVTMLPQDEHVEDVFFGAGGVLESAAPGTLVIDFSTVRPETSIRVAEAGAEKGLRVLDAPVSGGEKGALDEDHPLYAGMTGVQTSQRYGNASFLESDLVLALGARFGDRHTGRLDVYRAGRTFIHVDIEPTQIGKVFGPDLGIVSDTRLFLRAIIDLARARGAGRPAGEWAGRVRELKATLTRREDFDDVPIKAPRVYKEINEFYSSDTCFVTAIGLYQIWGGQHQKAPKPRHYQVCGQAGPLGWEIPAAIGVKTALAATEPDAEVVGIVGDYSFQFLVEELAVAAQYDVPFVLIMLNNEYLGLIRMAQDHGGYAMKYEADLHYDEYGTDNVKIMEAYGCAGTRVVEPDGIRPALEWARKEADRTSRPVLVEIMIEREADTANGVRIDRIREYEPVP